MTDRAWRTLSVASGGSEFPAPFNAAGRHVGDEVRSCIPHLKTFQIFQNLDDATGDGLGLATGNAARNHPATRGFGTVAVSSRGDAEDRAAWGGDSRNKPRRYAAHRATQK
jgi:hypothetical protein